MGKGASVQTHPGTVYQFGPFGVNAASGELLKNGIRVKLQEQPFRLLVVLLETPGEVVSREELRKRIWPEDTFVDFDGSLRVAVRKLREALDDDAEKPQYIETIPKRGYRFLTPVAGPIKDADRAAAPIDATVSPAAGQTGVARHRIGRWILSGVILPGLIVIVVSLLFPRNREVLTEKDTVVLADFTNSTGDPVFDETLRQGLAVQLEQSPFLSLISDERTQEELRLMGQPVNARITPQIAQEICVRTGSAVALGGSISSLGSQYVLGLNAKDCHTGGILINEQVQVARKEEVLSALTQMAGKFRTNAGEPLATVEKHNTPLAEATTPSLDALKAYSEGWKMASTQGEAAAVPFFKRAVEIDPKFAIAYAVLGVMYGSTGESDLAAEYTSKAYELRDRANDSERFLITAYYDGRTTGNQERALQTCEAWARAYPREFNPYLFLSGFIYPVMAEYEKGAAAGEKAIELSPDISVGYVNRSFNLVALDRLTDAESTLRLASERGPDVPFALLTKYDVAFLKADKAGMDRAGVLAQGNSGAEDWLADHQAAALAYAGHLQQARTMSEHAVALAQQGSHKERAALFETRVALREAFFGNKQAAKKSAEKALALATEREVVYGAALALALSGNAVGAEAMANDLEKRYPEDTSVRFSYVPVLRARLALDRGEPAKAIEQLQIASHYELGSPRSAINGFFGAMYPVYVRGEAYLVAHRGAEAAAEFEKILDHRGVVLGDPIGALAHLQLGRAYAISGEEAKAGSAYQDFFTLWKEADPGIPILKQARAEYAKL